MLKKNQKGDTIVEVLIVLAVLGLAIGISYATANRSLINARQAQESVKATTILQSQLENVRVLAASGDSAPPAQNVFTTTQPFCIIANTVRVATSTECSSIDTIYKIAITEDDNKFTLVATWDDVTGQGTDRATLIYRWYP